jgi:hypothetical protein
MNEFIAFIKNHAQDIINILNALGLLACSVSGLLLNRLFRRYLKRAKDRDTFTVCPKCGQQIKLSEMDFRLPDGSIDNDLDGKPDRKE